MLLNAIFKAGKDIPSALLTRIKLLTNSVLSKFQQNIIQSRLMCVYLCTALPVIRKLKSIYTVYNINIGKSAFYRLKKYAPLFAHRPDFLQRRHSQC